MRQIKRLSILFLLAFLLSGCTENTSGPGNVSTSPLPGESFDSQPEASREQTGDISEAGSSGPDFESSFWGDSMDEVMSSEDSAGNWLYEIASEFAGMKTMTYYVFDRDGNLQSGYHKLNPSNNDSAGKYETAKEYLISLYGQPASESFFAPDGTASSDLTDAIEAKGTGTCVWVTADNGQNAIYLYLLSNGDVTVAFSNY